MASLFQNNRMSPFSPRQQLENKYTAARSNLLLVIIFTAVNIGLLVANGNLYFLFSASIPYILTDLGMLLCGKYPEEVYAGELAGMTFLDSSFLFVMLVIAAITLTLYFLSWLFSKPHRVGWLIFALVLFALDTVSLFLFIGISIDSILDILFHAWVLYYLIMGLHAHFKLKKLPPEEETAAETAPPVEEQPVTEENASTDEELAEEAASLPDSPALRRADFNVKARVLAETEALGHRIQYRRVKRVNELVIDSFVYDDIEMLAETGHALNARIDGHAIQVGFDGVSKSYIKIDGKVVAQKLRLF